MDLGFPPVAAVDDTSRALEVGAQVLKELRMADEDVQGRRRPGVAAAGSLISLWLRGERSQEPPFADRLCVRTGRRLATVLPTEGAELPLSAWRTKHQDLQYIVLVQVASVVCPPACRQLVGFRATFSAPEKRSRPTA